MVRKYEDKDDEYVPENDNEYASENEDDHAPDDEEVVSDDDIEEVQEQLEPHEFEVCTLDGKVEVVRGAPLTEQEAKDEEDKIVNAVKQDPYFATMSERGRIRFAEIIHLYKYAHKHKEQEVLECSDDHWDSEDEGTKHRYIACKAGRYLKEDLGNGKFRLREMTDEEIASLASDDPTPCDCEVCKARRRNGLEDVTVEEVGLRSGKKRGWERYGPGRRL